MSQGAGTREHAKEGFRKHIFGVHQHCLKFKRERHTVEQTTQGGNFLRMHERATL